MTEPRVEIPQVDTTPYFTIRFPNGGTDARKHDWDTRYEGWWEERYRQTIDYNSDNPYAWLRDVKKARKALHSSDFYPQSVMMAAVNSPVLEISRLAAQTRKLNVDNFAYALAHLKISRNGLFDAEGVDPEEKQRYIDAQKRFGMSDEHVRRSILTAENIVAARTVFVEPDKSFIHWLKRKWIG